MLSSFIGRAAELDQLVTHVVGTRLITLSGSGGSGKTRLALEVARRAQSVFADGCWFVEFAPLSDPSDLASAIAQALRACQETTSRFSIMTCGTTAVDRGRIV
jgi:predicted ATPase